MLEIQNDTDGHRALRLYISKIFQRVMFYFFSCSKRNWIKMRTVNNIWSPFLESLDNLTAPKSYFKIKKFKEQRSRFWHPNQSILFLELKVLFYKSTKVVLTKVYKNHIDSATANILCFLKPV